MVNLESKFSVQKRETNIHDSQEGFTFFQRNYTICFASLASLARFFPMPSKPFNSNVQMQQIPCGEATVDFSNNCPL